MWFVNRFCKRGAGSRCLASTSVDCRGLVRACRAGDLERGQRPLMISYVSVFAGGLAVGL